MAFTSPIKLCDAFKDFPCILAIIPNSLHDEPITNPAIQNELILNQKIILRIADELFQTDLDQYHNMFRILGTLNLRIRDVDSHDGWGYSESSTTSYSSSYSDSDNENTTNSLSELD